jgi:hypothetical protein
MIVIPGGNFMMGASTAEAGIACMVAKDCSWP